MKIAVIGTGHVGLTTAACMAHLGHDVLGIDENLEKIRIIESGDVPFHEPGLADLLREGVASGRLRTSTVTEDAAASDIVFICVGTPPKPSGEADISQVEGVTRRLAAVADGYTVLAEKSTVPVGTAAWIQQTLDELAPDSGFDVASNPEFLQEGRAVRDTLEPTRIVIGVSSTRAADLLREAYRPIIDQTGCPVIVTDVATAELIKHSSNAYLATKISFINQVAEVCERTGANVETVAHAMGLDPRIGPAFLRAGIGYGGSCFPKDVQAFQHRASELGVDFPILVAAHQVNQERRMTFVNQIKTAVGDLAGKRIAVWGLSFKPETDDLRDAPAIDIIRHLLDAGARVIAHDPVAGPGAKDLIPELTVVAVPEEAVRGADALAVCTEWPLYAGTDLAKLRASLAQPVIVDGRNIFDPSTMEAAGFLYVSMGRPTVTGWAPTASS